MLWCPPPAPLPLSLFREKVNGQLSQTCYLRALDSCYNRLAAKKTAQAAAADSAADSAEASDEVGGDGGGGGGNKSGGPFVIGDVEHVLCHSPYNKLVQKSFARMAFSDARRLKGEGKPLGDGQEEALGKWLDVPAEVCEWVCGCVHVYVVGARERGVCA